ncbi:MAG: LON peptidase substrate-binding domain-containing protein, partial [Ruminococcus sp.]|nr:LON peptidase substrate-binding domain-containing protein [Ruminococcus sp.]
MEQIIINDKNTEDENVFYTVTMRGLVAFPKMVMHFDVAREKSVKSIESAVKGSGKIFLVAQKEAYTDSPKASDLYKTGVVAEIKQVLKLPDNIMKVLVQGVYKAKLVRFIDNGEKIMSEVKRVPAYSKVKYDEAEAEALMRSVKNAFENYASFFPKMPNDLMLSVMTQSSPVKLFESIVFSCNLDYRDKQILLEETYIIIKLSTLLS